METRRSGSGNPTSASNSGKWSTLIVTVLVLGLTAGALFDDRGLLGGSRLRVFLPENGPVETQNPGEAAAVHLAALSGREVAFVDAASEADLVIEPIHRFISIDQPADRIPVGTVSTGDRGDRAVLITAQKEPVDLERLAAADVAYTEANDPNGCWVQRAHLIAYGYSVQGEARYEGGRDHAVRLVLLVAGGGSTLGACRLSDITYLLERGLLKPGEVKVWAEWELLPEYVVSARGEAGWLVEILKGPARVLPSTSGGEALVISPADEKILERAARMAAGQGAELPR